MQKFSNIIANINFAKLCVTAIDFVDAKNIRLAAIFTKMAILSTSAFCPKKISDS